VIPAPDHNMRDSYTYIVTISALRICMDPKIDVSPGSGSTLEIQIWIKERKLCPGSSKFSKDFWSLSALSLWIEGWRTTVS